jgi:hypothetical protein
MVILDPDFYIYLVTSWAVIWACAGIYRLITRTKRAQSVRKSRAKRLSVILGLLSLPLLPYGIIEFQTWLFAPSLIPVIQKALNQGGRGYSLGIIGDGIVYYKVLSINPRHALIYVVTYQSGTQGLHGLTPDQKSGYSGFAVDLYKKGEKWVYDGNECICWSDITGAHGGSSFPPYPELGDFEGSPGGK